MNLLIHDLSDVDFKKIEKEYEDYRIVDASDEVRPCIGCFKCWTSGTGKCVFNDGYENMGQLIHEAEEMTIISRYTFGGFSSRIKGVFDRCIGYVLPEFETAYGEMHHKKRYTEDKPVTFIFRGNDLSEEDKDKARRYVAAVCRNLRGSVKDVIFTEDREDKKDTVTYKESDRSGTVLVNCSMRGLNSNTQIFLEKLKEDMETDTKILNLKISDNTDEILEEISKAKNVVLGMPLYVDGLPAPTIRLMEKIRDTKAGKDCNLYAVVNNGLYESRQNENIISMIKDWCKEGGLIYQGSLAIGAGEVMGVLMKDTKNVLWPARNTLNGLSLLAEYIDEGSATKDLYRDPYLFPRWLYIFIANSNWQLLKKKEK